MKLGPVARAVDVLVEASKEATQAELELLYTMHGTVEAALMARSEYHLDLKSQIEQAENLGQYA